MSILTISLFVVLAGSATCTNHWKTDEAKLNKYTSEYCVSSINKCKKMVTELISEYQESLRNDIDSKPIDDKILAEMTNELSALIEEARKEPIIELYPSEILRVLDYPMPINCSRKIAVKFIRIIEEAIQRL